MRPLIKYSKRKTLAIKVNTSGDVVVNAPHFVCLADIDKFILQNTDWITTQRIRNSQNKSKLYSLQYDPYQLPKYKKEILSELKGYVQEYCNLLNVKYIRFSLSKAKKRWGSCSSKGTIRLNWRLYFTPEYVKRYVALHEVVHLTHLNHSKSFWNTLYVIMPDYKKSIKFLRDNDYLLML